MEKKSYLPIGTVVLLKEGKKRLMIYGRKQFVKSENKEYDYMACLYPEGALNSRDVVLFNQEDIQMIYFIGFQDVEELRFRTLLTKEENTAESEE